MASDTPVCRSAAPVIDLRSWLPNGRRRKIGKSAGNGIDGPRGVLSDQGRTALLPASQYGPEQSRLEFSCATSKTRTDDAWISICRRLSTFHLGLFSNQNYFVPSHQKRSALGTHSHRISALESRDRRNCVNSSANALSAIKRTT